MLHKHELLCVKIQGKRQTVLICCKASMCLYFSIYSRPDDEEEACKQLRARQVARHSTQLRSRGPQTLRLQASPD